MPIKIPNSLPAAETLRQENIFVMTEDRASTQDIRPLEILLVNLMPTKIATETQFSRLLGNTPLQINLTLLMPKNHESKNTPPGHLKKFYKSFEDVKERNFDGCLITGAPLDFVKYEDVDYWDEVVGIMDWSKTHVHSTIFLCWGALAAYYHFYGIDKYVLPEKLFGVFPHTVDYKHSILFRGFDDVYYVPHSRHVNVRTEEIAAVPELRIMSSSKEAGVHVAMTKNGRQIFVLGHMEYDPDTLKNEYDRDVAAGKPIHIPDNYYPNDDPTQPPVVRWRGHGNLFYSNWLNYFVYQTTPYDISTINKDQ